MPKKPKIDHPVRQVRTVLGHTQPSFAKLVGCSAITIQRIENGSLKLSPRLAHVIAEATNGEPDSLMEGLGATARGRDGKPYSKESFLFVAQNLPMTDEELRYYLTTLVRYLELMLISSNRPGTLKGYAINAAVQDAFSKIAHDYDLVPGIERFLIDQGHVRRRKYRVSDLRKFPDYAQIIGFHDKKSYKPDKLVEFVIPHGWMDPYTLSESPVLPHGADMKLPNADYILDAERPIPDAVKEAIDQALYWSINSFERIP
jgi:DNA-binding XRE family transcriptional regulator